MRCGSDSNRSGSDYNVYHTKDKKKSLFNILYFNDYLCIFTTIVNPVKGKERHFVYTNLNSYTFLKPRPVMYRIGARSSAGTGKISICLHHLFLRAIFLQTRICLAS
jgi:hypothetical protein